jgi:hypothetical protein
VVGTVLSVALAVVLDVIYVLIERFSTPWARQGRQRDTRIDPGTPSRAAAVVGAPATPGAAAIATAGDAVGRIARG